MRRGWDKDNGVSRRICVSSPQVFYSSFLFFYLQLFKIDYAICTEWGTTTTPGARRWKRAVAVAHDEVYDTMYHFTQSETPYPHPYHVSSFACCKVNK
jgi:hypothetical protein